MPLLRSRAVRRATRAAVRARPELTPGLWVAAGDALWRHWREPVPEHLRRTKARAPGLRAAVRELVLPRFFVARGTPARPFPLAVAAYDGAVVLLDPAGGRVARTLPDGDVAGYRERRTRFAAHLGTPDFTVTPGLLVEGYVAGDHLPDLAPAAQVAVLADLLRRCAGLAAAAAAGDGTAAADLAAVADHVGAVGLPADLRHHLTRLPLTTWAAGWPLVPAATDATVRNLVVVAGRAVPIDVGDLTPGAFFEYPLGMVANARPHGLAAYLAGELDEEVAALFAAAGATWPLDAEGRVTLLAVRVALATLADVRSAPERTGGVGPAEATLFAAGASRRWRNLWRDWPGPWEELGLTSPGSRDAT